MSLWSEWMEQVLKDGYKHDLFPDYIEVTRMKQLIPTERFCLVQDESSHWHCIPVRFKKAFNEWQEAIENNDVDNFLRLNREFEFGQYRLNMHLTNYNFTDFKET